MDFPRYQFATECESELLRFLKVSKEQKSLEKNVDLKSYEVWKTLLPPDPVLLKKLDEYEASEITIIDSNSDDEKTEIPLPLEENDKEIGTNDDTSAISDIAFAIKENLKTLNDLSEFTKEQLLKFTSCDIEILFSKLEESLNGEEIFYMGSSLLTTSNNILTVNFCQYLLLPLVKKEYSDKFLKLMNDFCINNPSILTEMCLNAFQVMSDEEIQTCLQYVKKLQKDFQSILVRNFIFSIGKLNNNFLMIIQNLLNDKVEYEALNKLVELLSNIAEDHTKDKNFGKLLLQIIEHLGPNLLQLEQPLKHIITGHKSVWKAKLEKTFKNCHEDSLLFSQSFRD